jgi:MFS family permease
MVKSMKWILNDGRKVIPGIVMMLIMGTVYSYSVFRNPIEDQYLVSKSLSGLPYMLSLFFYAVFMFLSGILLEKLSVYKVMMIGIFLISFGWLIAYWSDNLMVLSLGYGLFIGSGIGLVYGIPLMIITHQYPNKKGIYMGLILLGFCLSPFVTAPLLQMMIESYGLSTSFLYMSIISFVSLFLLSLFYRHDQQANDRSIKVHITKKIHTRSFRILYLLFFIATFIGLSVIGFSSTYAYESLNYSLTEAAFFVSLFAIFNGLGRVVYGYLIDRFKPTNMMILSFVLLSISSLVNIIFAELTAIFIVTFIIFWFNLGGWLAIAPVSVSTFFGQKSYAKIYGVLFSAYGLSALIGVYVTGFLIDTFKNYQSSFIVFFMLSLIGLAVSIYFNAVQHTDEVVI